MENNTPCITIVTPCYNAEKFIAGTIESVLQQTYENWEMLIIDDGSSDNSIEIIKSYSVKDKRIKLLHTKVKSGAPSIPRNIGIENAKGAYIAFLDADDLWLPDKIEKELDFAVKNQFDLVYSYYEKIDFNGTRDHRVIKTRSISTYSSLLNSNSIPCLTSFISIKAIGDTRFKEIPQEDFCFWLDILKKGYIGYNLCEVTALYRESNSSRSSNKLDMFKGYWNVIRNQQRISFLPSCLHMINYCYLGFTKYLK